MARTDTGIILIKIFEAIKSEIADVRTPLVIDTTNEKEVRLATIKAIDVYLIDQFKARSADYEGGEDDFT
jgi:hypothetical protein